MEVTTMLSKELNSEMEFSTEELEEEQIDLEYILKCIDMIRRVAKDRIVIKRWSWFIDVYTRIWSEPYTGVRIPGADCSLPFADENHAYTYIDLRIGDSEIKHIKIRVLHNRDDINKRWIDGHPDGVLAERDDIKCVIECIKRLTKYTRRGACIRKIMKKIPAQAYYNKRRKHRDGRYTRLRIENLSNGIEQLIIKIVTDN